MTFLRNLIVSLFSLIVSLVGASVLAVVGAAIYFAPGLPDVRQLQDFELHTPLRIFTQDGKLIGEYGEERRMAINFDEIPQDMIDALTAAEDASYFEHAGVDPRGLARAVVQLAMSGDIQSGGSTITMQVARNYMLTLDQTFTRKIREEAGAGQRSRAERGFVHPLAGIAHARQIAGEHLYIAVGER